MSLQLFPYAEPILIGGSLTGGGLVIIWFARAIIDIRDSVISVMQTLHGPKDAPGTGLVAKVDANHRDISGALGALSHENIVFDKRLTRVEDRCKIIHQLEDEQ